MVTVEAVIELLTEEIAAGAYSKTSGAGLIVPFIGPVGVGKGAVARFLAEKLGAPVIESVKVFRTLKDGNVGFGIFRQVERAVAEQALDLWNAVILDGDHADKEKIKLMAQLASKRCARLVFIRLVCPPEYAFTRLADQILGNQSCEPFESWGQKLCRLAERLDLHYERRASGGFKRQPKRLQFGAIGRVVNIRMGSGWQRQIESNLEIIRGY